MPEKIGKYDIIESIGRGGTGTVYKALDSKLKRLVALKVLTTEAGVDDELRARLLTEAQACSGLSHPNVVTIFDIGDEGDQVFIVMELLDGSGLNRLLADRAELSIEDKVSAVVQVCGALEHAHQRGVVHRDIKPGNIIFQIDGPVKIGDFGMSALTADAAAAKGEAALTTMRYMSPEQVKALGDARSDQYALAAVLYEMLAGRAPYIGDDAAKVLEQLAKEKPPGLLELVPSLPPELVKIVEKAMSREAADRYADLKALRTELEPVLRTLAEEAERVRQQLPALIAKAVEMEAALAKRLTGTAPEAKPPAAPAAELPRKLDALRKQTDEAGKRIEELTEKTRKLDACEPVLKRGAELLAAGKFAEARAEFEGVLGQLPDYTVVAPSLEKARAGEEEQKRRESVRKMLDEAKAALEKKEPSRSLELLQQVSQVPAPAEFDKEFSELRDASVALQKKMEETEKARQQAAKAKDGMLDARRAAEEQGAAKYATALWSEGQKKLEQGQTEFGAEKFAEALKNFEGATADFKKAEADAREAAIREKKAAEEAEAARRLKLATEFVDEARTALNERVYKKAQELIKRADEVPPPDSMKEAVRTLSEKVEAELKAEADAKEPAAKARDLMGEMKTEAQEEGGPGLASTLWAAAEAKAAEGAAAVDRELFRDAVSAFEVATKTYRLSTEEARAAKVREKDAVEKALQAAEAEESRQRIANWVRDARAALGRGDDALSLGILAKVAAAGSVPEEMAADIASLRKAAETAQKHRLAGGKGAPVAVPPTPSVPETPPAAAAATPQPPAPPQPPAAPQPPAPPQGTPAQGQAAPAAPPAPPTPPAQTPPAAAPPTQPPAAAPAAPTPPAQTPAAAPAPPPQAPPAAAPPAAATPPPAAAPAQPQPAPAAAKVVPGPSVAPPPRKPDKVEKKPDKKAAPAPAAKAKDGKASAPAAAAGKDDEEAAPSKLPVIALAVAALVALAVLFLAPTPPEPPAAPARPAPASPPPTSKPAEPAPAAEAPAEKPVAAPVEKGPAALTPPPAVDPGSKADAESARTAALSARFAAAKADASRLAPETHFASQRKELEADTALAKGEYAHARQLYDEARAGFDAGAAEAAAKAAAGGAAAPAAEPKAGPGADAKPDPKAAADAAAAKAKTEADAKAKTEAEAKAKADAKTKAEAEAKAKAEADAQAKAVAEAKAKADAEAKADAAAKLKEEKAAEAARAKTAAAEPETAADGTVLENTYAVLYAEPTDGKRGGGTWGACWRANPEEARACAKASCDSKRDSDRNCVEAAISQRGDHCAVARASGYGVSWGACKPSKAAAEGAAMAGCGERVTRTYGNVPSTCEIVWSTAKR